MAAKAAATVETAIADPTHPHHDLLKGYVRSLELGPWPRAAAAAEGGRAATVLAGDTLAAAHALREEHGPDARIAVLNMASEYRRGGGWRDGANAQEEALCRRSTLGSTLEAAPATAYPIPDGDAYWCQALVFLDDAGLVLESPYRVGVITCPAPRKPKLFRGRYAPPDRERMRQRWVTVCRAAAAKNVEHLVLGAYGCGVFRNPPEEVAELAREVLAGFPFASVTFAILKMGYDRHDNHAVFTRAFGAGGDAPGAGGDAPGGAAIAQVEIGGRPVAVGNGAPEALAAAGIRVATEFGGGDALRGDLTVLRYPLPEGSVPADPVAFAGYVWRLRRHLGEFGSPARLAIRGGGSARLVAACLVVAVEGAAPADAATRVGGLSRSALAFARRIGSPVRFYQAAGPTETFTNFSHHPVAVPGLGTFPTSEGAFQAFKAPTDPAYVAKQVCAASPAMAKRLGRRATLRPDWETVKVAVMRDVLRLKAAQTPLMCAQLRASGLGMIFEHTKTDRIWADGGDGTGQNLLGRLLWELRGAMHEATAQP